MSNSSFMKRYSVIIFLGLVFGISWLILYPVINSYESLESLPMLVLYILASLVPGLVTLILIWRTEGLGEVKRLLQSLVAWQNKPRWLTTSIVLPCVLIIIIIGVLSYNYGMDLAAISIGRWLLSIPNLILNLFLFGLISNEISWRGFLLPRFQLKRSAIVSSLLVGCLWALWQVPTYYVSGIIQAYQSITWLFIEVISLSIILTWLFNSTGSLSFGLIFHAVYITLAQTISPAVQLSGNIAAYQQINGIILVNIALLILLFCGGKNLIFIKPKRKSPDKQ